MTDYSDFTSIRTAPQNIEAEQALLGAILVNNATYEKVSDRLRPEHFFHPHHQRIYAVIAQRGDNGQLTDAITCRDALPDLAQYLGELMGGVITIINAGQYAHTIYGAYQRRELIEAATAAVNSAYDGGDAEEMIAKAEEALYTLRGDHGAKSQEPVSLGEAAARAVRHTDMAFKNGGLGGIQTGLVDLDRNLGGLLPGDLVLIAARPSMGKSMLAITIGDNLARTGTPVGFFSMEMTSQQVAMTRLAGTGIDLGRQRSGRVGVTDVVVLQNAAHEMRDIPLMIDDRAGLTIGELSRRARRMKRRHNIQLLLIDYIQLMSGGGRGRSDENRNMEITMISQGLKTLGKELEIPIIALSQLSRQVEGRDDKRPQLSDLRDSGALEQDADTIIFPYRREYYLAKEEPAKRTNETSDKLMGRIVDWNAEMDKCRGQADLIIAKQRFGPVPTTVPVRFDGVRQRFENLYRGHAEAAE